MRSPGGEVGVGFVPIENSIEGMVNFTLDALAFDHDLIITAMWCSTSSTASSPVRAPRSPM